MKQKFFTLLLGLAMVSVNVWADGATETISVGTAAAKTYVSANNLNFRTLTNYDSGTPVQITPYYISDYRGGRFTLARYEDGIVPKGYPMILFSKTGGGDFEVPIVDDATAEEYLNDCKSGVYTAKRGKAYLVPVIKGGSFSARVAPINNSEGDLYNYTFWSIPSSGDDFVTESGVEKYRLDGQVELNAHIISTKDSMTIYEVDQTRAELVEAFGGEVDGVETSYADANTSIDDLTVGGESLLDVIALNQGIIIYTPSYTQIKRVKKGKIWIDQEIPHGPIYWYVFKKHWTYTDPVTGDFYEGIDFEGFPTSKLTEGSTSNVYYSETEYDIVPWDTDLGAWYTETNTQYKNKYNQYILGVSGGNPVFKKCPITTGANRAKVAVNGCFARVYVTTEEEAASREFIGFEFDEEEQTLQESEVSGIRNLKNDLHQQGIYNMNGQKLVKLQKGMNIVNGKKIYVK